MTSQTEEAEDEDAAEAEEEEKEEGMWEESFKSHRDSKPRGW